MRSRRNNPQAEKLRKLQKTWLVESVRKYVLPAFIQRGFTLSPQRCGGPVDDEKHIEIYPLDELRRPRPDGGLDLVEIQFSTYGRAAFRINATPVPKEGVMTLGGHRRMEELHAGGLHDHFETHARPWLRPVLRALRIEAALAFFSAWHWPYAAAKPIDWDALALKAASVVPEVDLALREGELGPHILRRFSFVNSDRTKPEPTRNGAKTGD